VDSTIVALLSPAVLPIADIAEEVVLAFVISAESMVCCVLKMIEDTKKVVVSCPEEIVEFVVDADSKLLLSISVVLRNAGRTALKLPNILELVVVALCKALEGSKQLLSVES
jgi:hypothetical protein